MSTVTINYAMNGTGDLDSKLDGNANKLDKVANNAKKADSAMEKFTKNRQRMDEFGKSLGENVENWTAVVEWVGFFVEGIHAALSVNKEYSNSVAHLSDEFGRLRQTAMDAIGPDIAKFVNSLGVGFVYLGNLIPDVLGVAFQFMQDGFRDNLIFAAEVINQVRYMWNQFRAGEVIDLDQVLADLQGANALLVVDLQSAMADIFRAESDARDAAFEAFKRQKEDIVTEINSAAKTLDKFTGPNIQTDLLQQMQFSGDAFAQGVQEALMDGAKVYAEYLTDELRTAQEAAAAASAAKMASATSAASSLAGGGGLSAVLSIAAGPLGSLVGSLIDLVKNAPDVAFSILKEVLDIYLNLDEWVGKLAGEFVPYLVRMAPLIVTSFITLLPRIFGELVVAMPKIAAAFVTATLSAIPLFVSALKEGLKEFARELVQAVQPFKDPGGLFRTELGPNAETKRLFGVKLPFQGDKLADGGVVARSGLAWVDKGEVYSGVRGGRARSSVGNTTINIGTIVARDPRDFATQLRQLQGNFGIGLRTDPLIGGE